MIFYYQQVRSVKRSKFGKFKDDIMIVVQSLENLEKSGIKIWVRENL